MEHCRIGKTNPLGNPIERQTGLLDQIQGTAQPDLLNEASG
jgi:hypothetical protein